MQAMWSSLALFLLVLGVGCTRNNAEEPRHIVTEFQDPTDAGNHGDEDGPQFTRLVVDKNTGHVYVGGVNRLYQLSTMLELTVTAVTGPRYDSPLCSVLPDCPPTAEKNLTNNFNKALIIDYSDSRIIECGSLYQGICTVRSLRNISNIEEQIKEPVVANNAIASTVAFIAPGPPIPPFTQVLYVGVTYTGNGPYRSKVPAVSSRSLDSSNLFQIAMTYVTTGTRMFVNSLAREIYPINYVYGFSSEGFSFFLTTQMRETIHSPYHSKIVRVCHDDADYYSYTEVPLQCNDANDDYTLIQAAYVGKPGSDLAAELGVTVQDDVLFAVFATPDSSEGNITSKPSKKSALCVYSLKTVRRQFLKNIQSCFIGNGKLGLDFISPSRRCINTRLTQIGENFCGLDINTPLGGQDPIQSGPVLTFDAQLTAVTATSTGDLTVVFLGTSDGHLKKVVVESSAQGFEYADIPIAPGTSVQSDILFDLKKNHMFVMTERKLSKVRVQNCEQYSDCNQCLRAKDPYCGWCSHDNKCSLRGDCKDAAFDLYWISYKSGRCTTITSVNPHELQRKTVRTLQLVIENLPNLLGQFLCAFSAQGKTLTTIATRTPSGISCTTPRTNLLPIIPSGESHFTSQLAVRVADGPNLVTTNFTFFDCNSYSSCNTCVSSPFPCDWCVEGHDCTHDSAENCNNGILVMGVNRLGPSIRSGPSFCPQVNVTLEGSPEILVSSGLQKSVRVKVNNIAQFILQTQFVCQFNIEGRVTSVNTQLLSDTIYCDEMDFTYTSRVPNITATFAVIWGQSKPLDNPDNIHVQIYRCKEMATNCGTCLSLDSKYQCGWCEASKRCEVKAQCGGEDNVSWLDRDQTCPDPRIISSRQEETITHSLELTPLTPSPSIPPLPPLANAKNSLDRGSSI